MSNEKIDDDFENSWATIRQEWASGGLSAGGLKGLAKKAWDQSREKLCVTVPIPHESQFETEFEYMVAMDFVSECAKAIKAAGATINE
jgi:hypothetical protein